MKRPTYDKETRRFLAHVKWAVRRARRDLPRLEIPAKVQKVLKDQGYRLRTV